MKSIVLLSIALAFSCGVTAEEQGTDCHSWWSGSDGIRHCVSGTGVIPVAFAQPQVVASNQPTSKTPFEYGPPPPDDIQQRTGPGYLPLDAGE